MKNEHLNRWGNIIFYSDEKENNVNFAILLFPDPQSGKDAIAHLNTWPELNFAIVKEDNGHHTFVLYNETDTYELKTTHTADKNDIAEFIRHAPANRRYGITCGVVQNKELFVDMPASMVVVHHYVYTDRKHFNYQRVSRVN